jgi:hypothetical protein
VLDPDPGKIFNTGIKNEQNFLILTANLMFSNIKFWAPPDSGPTLECGSLYETLASIEERW